MRTIADIEPKTIKARFMMSAFEWKKSVTLSAIPALVLHVVLLSVSLHSFLSFFESVRSTFGARRWIWWSVSATNWAFSSRGAIELTLTNRSRPMTTDAPMCATTALIIDKVQQPANEKSKQVLRTESTCICLSIHFYPVFAQNHTRKQKHSHFRMLDHVLLRWITSANMGTGEWVPSFGWLVGAALGFHHDWHCVLFHNLNKKLSYRRETARQLPTWRGLSPPVHSPSPSG